MSKILSAFIFPHPPVIVPDVGKGKEAEAKVTIEAIKKACERIKALKPTTIVVTTPHGPMFSDYVYISTKQHLEGNFRDFGAPLSKLEFDNNLELVNRIIELAEHEGIPCGGLEDEILKRYKFSAGIDHGALVPLYFIKQVCSDFKLIHISSSGLPLTDLYKFGSCIMKASEENDERVVFVASGDMSHRLSDISPYGYNKMGKLFDDLVIKSIETAQFESLLKVDEDFSQNAGECGLRSFVIMSGALEGYDVSTKVYSYEGPFGIGYAVAEIDVEGKNPDREILKRYLEARQKELWDKRKNEDEYIKLARTSLEAYIKDMKKISVPQWVPSEMLENKTGTFVSIKKFGQLRGCIGTTGPTKNNIAEEIISNAISSGTRDPRFDPIGEDELEYLEYSVDVLKEPEKVNSVDELDVNKYGVIVYTDNRSGLLLPNLEGVDTIDEQVEIALSKAGISKNEKFSIKRFEVVRHKVIQ